MNHSLLLPTQRRLAGDALSLAPALDGSWELPVQYAPAGRRHEGVLSEYGAAIEPGRAALYDGSWLGILELRGSDRAAFLQGMVSNGVHALAPGRSCHAALLDSTGHILADLRVHAAADSLLLTTDPRCLPTLRDTLDRFLIMEDVQIADVSEAWIILSLLGPAASDLLAACPHPSATVFPAAFAPVPGLDLWLPRADGPAAWESLVASGATPLGEQAREALRVEAGLPAWGRELTPAVLLPEAEMDDAVSYTKGCYVGQEIVARLHARGHTNRALRRILLAEDAPVPPPGSEIHVPEDGPEPGREIGRITSALASPHGGRALALGYVRKEYLADGTAVSVQIAQPGGPMFSYGAAVVGR